MAQEDIAVTRFRDYLRINTSQPTPDYDAAREFFEKYASELGLPFQSVMLAGNRSMDIFTWEGTEPSLPSIALYSHIDVVPSFPEHWKYDPFSAHKDENGDIFARGSQGGVQFNVVPDVMKACFDVRVPPTVDFEEFENQIKGWCAEAGPDVTVRFQQKTTFKEVTATDSSSPWWLAFSRACEKSGVTLKKEIFPAGADARYLRQRGIPAYGFSPMNRTPILLHDHNEYLNEATFLRGVDIYCNIIPALTSVCV
ncbi:aminoacylase-1B [Aplysia californica]|uniref:Aminoacylase-1B n=1 Tax=Aplysia californica TaxID=6500 RepID=A0ABM0ZVN9_APLCA|nr:aminoacylase-1B [Aplysia californica]